MNYWESADGRDQRLIFAMNSLLQEIDAKTGKSIMSFGTNGVVDLRDGLDGRDPETHRQHPVEHARRGLREPDHRRQRHRAKATCRRRATSAPTTCVTGKLVWTFHTVPRPGEFGYDTWPKDAWKYVGGTNTWGEMTVDARRGIVYFPLGSPTYDFYGADRDRRQPVRHVARRARRAHRQAAVALPDRAPRPLGPRPERRAAADDDPPQRTRTATSSRWPGQDGLALRVRPRDGRADLADRRAAGAEERRCRASRAGRRSRSRPTRRRSAQTVASASTTSIRICRPRRTTPFKQRAAGRDEQGHVHAHQLQRHGAHPDEQRRRPVRRRRVRARAPARSTSSRTTTRGFCACCDRERRLGAAAPSRYHLGRLLYQQNCQVCHGPTARAPDSGTPLIHATADPANNIAAGAPRFDAAAIRTVLGAGKGRMPRFPHFTTADVDNLVALPDGGPGRPWGHRRRARPRRGGGLWCATGADRRIGFSVDAAGSAGRRWARWRAAVSGRRAAIPSSP